MDRDQLLERYRETRALSVEPLPPVAAGGLPHPVHAGRQPALVEPRAHDLVLRQERPGALRPLSAATTRASSTSSTPTTSRWDRASAATTGDWSPGRRTTRSSQFRTSVDARVEELIRTVPDEDLAKARVPGHPGIQHEQQHQELLVTEIKHILGSNVPGLREPYRPAAVSGHPHAPELRWRSFEAGLHEFGNREGGWCWDNELPVHKAYLDPFALSDPPGHQRRVPGIHRRRRLPRPACSGSTTAGPACRSRAGRRRSTGSRPRARGGSGRSRGMRPLDPDEPVCHVSFYEADAFARWRRDALSRRAAAQRARVGARGRALGLPGRRPNFLDTRPPPPGRRPQARRRPRRRWRASSGSGRSATTSRIPATSRSRRPGRVQRQVHGQPAGAARRLVRHAARPHPRQLPQLLGAGHALPVHRDPAGAVGGLDRQQNGYHHHQGKGPLGRLCLHSSRRPRTQG